MSYKNDEPSNDYSQNNFCRNHENRNSQKLFLRSWITTDGVIQASFFRAILKHEAAYHHVIQSYFLEN